MPVKGYRGSHHLVTAREYERAPFNQLYYVFRRPHYIVVPDQRALRGLLSSARRQIDVSVYRSGQPQPAIAVECKRFGRRLNIKDIESFLGMLEDLGAQRGVLVAPLGYSRAAERRVHGTRVDLHRLAERDAVRLNWRELARAVFPWDEGFHREMADAFDAVMIHSDMGRAADALEAVAFEEWEAAILAIFSRMPDRATTLLRGIAASHFDDGWRYNAVRILDERGEMDAALASELRTRENDPETLELLIEIINAPS
jgi:Restriction endonuclease